MKKYDIVLEYIEKLYNSNKIHVGEKLPSIRNLSAHLNVNKSTIIRAYEILIEQHKAYVIPKSGYYWLQRQPDLATVSKLIDFTKLHPDPDLLPYKEFEHCIGQAINIYKTELFNYGSIQGLPSLLKALKIHFSKRQIHTNEECIYITSGSQQALSLLCDLSMYPYDANQKGLIVEQPSYSLIQKLPHYKNITMVGVSRNKNGLNLKALEQLFKSKKYKFFYTIPRCHNPLGTDLSEKEKLKIVELAHKYKMYIIEDDFVADLTVKEKQLPLHYYDTHDRVIYVKSFSKAFLPGIRLGALVLPKSLISDFSIFKRMHDLNTSVLSQGALELYLTSGLYDKHTKKAKKYYNKKHQIILNLLNQINLKDVEVIIPESGFLSYIEFKNNFPFELFMQLASNRGLKINPINDFFLSSNNTPKAIRLCYAALSEEEIKKGLLILIEILKKLSP